MDLQDGVNLGEAYEYSAFEQPQLQNGEVAMPSPDSRAKPPSKLQLPMSCDPPVPGNPAKQLVWIVCFLPHLKSPAWDND
jgi:hypothetical protein